MYLSIAHCLPIENCARFYFVHVKFESGFCLIPIDEIYNECLSHVGIDQAIILSEPNSLANHKTYSKIGSNGEPEKGKSGTVYGKLPKGFRPMLLARLFPWQALLRDDRHTEEGGSASDEQIDESRGTG